MRVSGLINVAGCMLHLSQMMGYFPLFCLIPDEVGLDVEDMDVDSDRSNSFTNDDFSPIYWPVLDDIPLFSPVDDEDLLDIDEDPIVIPVVRRPFDAGSADDILIGYIAVRGGFSRFAHDLQGLSLDAVDRDVYPHILWPWANHRVLYMHLPISPNSR